MKFILVVCCLCLVLAGCGDKKVDTSSEASMKKSMDQIRAALSEADRVKFDDAVKVLAFADLNKKNLLAIDPEQMKKDMLKRLEGKTANEIIAEADKVKDERRAQQREQALLEIADLEAKKRTAEEAKGQMKAFQVLSSKYYKSDDALGMKDPVIELRVRNGMKQAISRACFHGVLATPSRAVPWVSEDFNYHIRGGLEPGEEAVWKMHPNMFQGWGSTPDRDDMILTVEVVRLDGADEQPLFTTKEFTKGDASRLEKLKKEFQP